jgi:hypothetical protein
LGHDPSFSLTATSGTDQRGRAALSIARRSSGQIVAEV